MCENVNEEWALLVEDFDWEHPQSILDENGQTVQVASVVNPKILEVYGHDLKRYALEDACMMNQSRRAQDGLVGYRVVPLSEALKLTHGQM